MSMASFIHIVEGGDISSFDISSSTMSSKIFAQQCSSSHFFVHIIIDDTSFFLVDKSVAATFPPLPHLSPAKQQGSFHQSWLRVRGRDERTARSAMRRREKMEGKKEKRKRDVGGGGGRIEIQSPAEALAVWSPLSWSVSRFVSFFHLNFKRSMI